MNLTKNVSAFLCPGCSETNLLTNFNNYARLHAVQVGELTLVLSFIFLFISFSFCRDFFNVLHRI